MTHVHVRRYRADEADDNPDAPGTLSGTISDLTAQDEDEDTGLVDLHGQPVLRKLPARRPIGFRPPGECSQ